MSKKSMTEYQLIDKALKIISVGSRVVCDPPVTDTDDDILILLGDDLPSKVEGFDNCGYDTLEDDALWQVCKQRNGDRNYIITHKREQFDRFLAASAVCKMLNVRDKNMRKHIHRLIVNQDFSAAREVSQGMNRVHLNLGEYDINYKEVDELP